MMSLPGSRHRGTCAAWLLLAACSSSKSTDSSASGGSVNASGGSANGGAMLASGGNANGGAAAGATASGGAVAQGGAVVNGGLPSAGGTGGNAGADATAGAAAGGKVTTCPAQTVTAVVPAGSEPEQPAGATIASTVTRPQLSKADADASYTIREALKRGGDFTIQFAAGGAGGAAASGGAAGVGGASGSGGRGAISYAKNDDWDPLSNGIGDVSRFVPTYTVAADGSGTHTKLQAAIDEAVFLAECPRAYIRVMPGIYRETIKIPAKTSAPPITIYSTESDSAKTVIVKDNSAVGSPSGETIAPGISASATFTQSAIANFQAKNITIANDYVEGTLPGDDQSAVALLNQGDRAQYENVRLLGNRFTLYVKSTNASQAARSYFRDSYIEGDESFVAGRGTAVFDHCQIHSLGSRVATGGVIAAPSTWLNNPHGFLFISSEFSAETSASEVALGRQWFEGMQAEAIGKMVVRNSTIGAHVMKANPWLGDSGRITPKQPTAPTTPTVLYSSDDYFAAGQAWTPSEPFLAEFGNAGTDAAP